MEDELKKENYDIEGQNLKIKSQVHINSTNIQYGSIDENDDDTHLITNKPEGHELNMNVFAFLCSLKVEPLVFSFLFVYMMNKSVLTNMMMDKGCLYYFNYTEEVCGNLSSYDIQKDQVEILGNNYTLYYTLTNLIGAIITVFISPWSDKYGRKLPLLVSVLGSIFTNVFLMLCAMHFESELFYIVLAAIPSQISGGFICFLTIMYCHATEVSSEVDRTMKYTTVEIGFSLGMSLGMFTGGMVYKYYGYAYIFGIGTVIQILCIPWLIMVIPETAGLDKSASWRNKLVDFFSLENTVSGFKATFRQRKNNERMMVLLYFASMCTVVLMYESYAGIAFVYAHHIYNWDPTDYSNVFTSFTVAQLPITLILAFLLIKMLKVSNYVLGVMGSLSLIGKNLLLSLAKYKEYVYYLGMAAGLVGSFTTLAIRSEISKIADKDELGRVFSFLATCESVVPMLGNIAVTKIFNATIDTYPSASYLIASVLLLLPVFVMLLASYRSRKSASS